MNSERMGCGQFNFLRAFSISAFYIGAFTLFLSVGATAQILYVDVSATGSNNGTSWTDAYIDLQDALSVANSGDTIWVATGTYYPTTNTSDRNATFQLLNEVSLFGGFEGTETTLAERNWETHETILSGDINQSGSLAGNSYTVVIGSFTNSTAVMDGFTITGGNADVSSGGSNNPNRSGGGMYNEDGSPTVTNSTFSGNSANGGGGGMYNRENSSPVITNSTFSGNSANNSGGGMNNDFSSPTITNSTFSGNSANNSGGGMYNLANNSSPTITNSTFSGNSANFGGGMYNFESSPVIANSTFSGNSANSQGGGMCNEFNSSPVITNSTFSGNSANSQGGGMLNRDNSSPTITNSIIWNNSANGSTVTSSASVFNIVSSNLTSSYSLIANSGGSGSWASAIGTDGGNNIDVDPLFAEDVDLDSVPTTLGNLRLQACSPAIDAGDNSALSASDSLDLDGNPRFHNATGADSAIVDMGAYEFQGSAPETGNPNVIYVNASNVIPGTGLSWDCAFTDLQQALATAQSGDSIWVAAGTYYPSDSSGMTPMNPRNATFQLKDSVAIYGGFAGGETTLSEREWETHETILSGDINQTDSLDGNSYTVVTGSNTDNTAILNGFSLTMGNSIGASFPRGGGLWIVNGSSVIENCKIYNNFAAGGAGLSVESSDSAPLIENCSIFENESTGGGGGAIVGFGASPVFHQSNFIQNSGSIGGGVSIFSSGSNPEFINCEFTGNISSGDGGGISSISEAAPIFSNCLINGNSAGSNGGGIRNLNSSPTITNSTFSGNSADFGGGMYNEINSSPTITNGIFWGNGSSNIFNNASSPIINYSLLQESACPSGATCNEVIFDQDPLFADTSANNYQLTSCSPAINAGNPDTTGLGLPALDLAGNPRIVGDTIDMGAYEQGGVPCGLECPEGTIVYVKEGGTGDGSSWTEATGSLQDALELGCGCYNIEQIWVATGTYYADEGMFVSDNDRNATFQMCNGVQLLGGFPDSGDPNLGDRDWTINETTLSGDINQSDSLDGNSYTVITGSGTDNTAVIDGFNITMGNADGNGGFPDPNFRGGAIYSDGGNFSLKNLKLENNSAGWGGAIYLLNSANPEIENTTISSNQASNSGGGMYNVNSSSPTVTNSTFSGNSANFGGGMFNDQNSSPTITNSTFSGNTAGSNGGGMYNTNSSSPTLTNSTFSGNTAGSNGGGMYNTNSSSPTLTNSTFSGNTAGSNGGGMYNTNSSSPTLTNSTFSGNSAGNNGGGMFNFNSSPTITNGIFWGNGSSNIFNYQSSPIINYSLIQESTCPSGATCNEVIFDQDPLFADTSANNFQLTSCSPAINAGNPDTTGLGLPAVDLAGNPRIVGDTIDMGAYEQGGVPCGLECPEGTIVYVKAGGMGDGSSWTEAIGSLQDALEMGCGCYNIEQIWVATGTYYADEGLFVNGDDRDATFQLCNGVKLLGGFPASGDPTLSDRDWTINETILSGDINQTDSLDGNSYTVVTGSNTDNTAILNGFSLTMGNSIGASFPRGGGLRIVNGSSVIENCKIYNNFAAGGAGLSVESSDSAPLIENCSIFENESTGGGGGAIVGFGASPVFHQSNFIQNSGSLGGGVSIFSSGSNPEFINCEFTGNTSSGAGGGISSISEAAPIFSNCLINGNSAGSNGGGMRNLNSSPTITNSTFSGNSADFGGGMYFLGDGFNGDYRMVNCLFYDNSAVFKGGAIGYDDQDGGTFEVINSTFINNTAGDGGLVGITFWDSGNVPPTFIYCIGWDNSSTFGQTSSSTGEVVFNHTLIQEASCPTGATCNSVIFDQDPLFADTSANNFQLTSCSPAINAGNPDTTGMNLPATDLAGNPRIVGDTIDMGAYEQGGVPCGLECPEGTIVYVKEGGTGDGSSWTEAIGSLQDALEMGCGCYNIEQIWVATGTYYADEGLFVNGADRDATFQLCNGVELLGGFPASGDPTLSNRDWTINETTLSGDINQTGNLDGNSYTVVTGSGTDHTAVMDGFTITMGNANAPSGGFTSPNRSGGGMYNASGSSTVMNCIFSGNSAFYDGGGMYNDFSSPTITNSTFSGNEANNGGGMYITLYSSPEITNSTFTGNEANKGGGMYITLYSSPEITNSTFTGNSANNGGGGMYNSVSSPTITNSTFSWNEAGSLGGGMSNEILSSPMITNSTFSGNSANFGGGMYNSISSSPTLTNSTFSGNSAGNSGGGMYNNFNSSPTITNGIFWGNGSSNIFNNQSYPIINYSLLQESVCPSGATCNEVIFDQDPLFADTSANNYQLTSCSPAINAGNPDTTGLGLPAVDLAGNPRIVGDTIDMGAYEQGGVPCGLECPEGTIVYVKEGGMGDGSSWTEAIGSLQDALEMGCGCYNIEQIWVATGTYYADEGLFVNGDDRDATFQLCNGVELLGGFPATGDPTLSDRDWTIYETTLSGDINQTDSLDGNSYTVVTGSGTDHTAVMDGFTITMGNANAPSGGFTSPNRSGGGMYNASGSSTVMNCTFSGNSTNGGGGGMFNTNSSSPTVMNCIFSGNSAFFDGGGMYNDFSSPTITNSTFSGNTAGTIGGGMSNWNNSSPVITNSTFSGNSANFGGGMVNDQNSSPIITNSTFSGNSAGNNGGGMVNDQNSSPIITNSTFSGNSAGNNGGGMSNWNNSSPVITNSTFSGNSANFGGGMYNVINSSPVITNSTFSGNSANFGGGMINLSSSSPTITNGIFWGNGSSNIFNSGSSPTINYSLIQESTCPFGATCNEVIFDQDPLFADTSANNFQLTSCSPAINAGNPDTTGMNLPATDLAGNPRIFSDTVDMGSYELQSMRALPLASCLDITLQLDENGNVSIEADSLDNGSSGCAPLTFLINGDSVLTFDCTDLGVSTGILTVTDNIGITDTCALEISIEDNVAPIAECEDVTVQLNATGDGSTTAAEVDNGSNDACGIQSLSLSQTEFDCDDVGIPVEITLTVSDNSNTATCTADVTVEDNVAPTAQCQDVTVQLDANGGGSTTAAEVDNGSNDACGIQSLSLSQTEFDCDDVGIPVEITLTVSDNSNTATCTADVTVEDNVAPMAQCQDVTVQLDANGEGSTTAAEVDNGSNDACGIGNMSLSQTEFDCGNVGNPVELTLTVEDNNGNTALCTLEVEVSDNIGPEVSCALSVNQQVSSPGDTSVYVVIPLATANDNCGVSEIQNNYNSGGADASDSYVVGTTVVEYSATDIHGNESTCHTEVIVVEDNSVVAVCKDTLVSLGENGELSIPAEGLDGGSFGGIGILDFTVDGESTIDIDCSEVGTLELTLTVTDEESDTDECGVLITVEDNTAPSALCQDVTVELDGTGAGSLSVSEIDNGSTDNCSIVSMELDRTTFECADLGLNVIVLTVVDESNNSGSCTSEVLVEDQISPSVSCQDASVEIGEGGTGTLSPSSVMESATDNCGVSMMSLSQTIFSCTDLGQTTVVLTVMDDSGNEGTCESEVTITDELGPEISCAFEVSVEVLMPGDTEVFVNVPVAGIEENCELESVENDYNVGGANASDVYPVGTTTVTYTAEDVNGNISTCITVVNVVPDNELVAVCDDITVSLEETGELSLSAEEVDGGSFGGTGTLSFTIEGQSTVNFDCGEIGENTVTLVVMDEADETDNCEAVVTIEDTTPPAVLCQDVSIQLNANGEGSTTAAEVDNGSNDACGISNLSLSQTEFDCGELGTIAVTLTVEDNNSNTATCLANLTVEDLINPTINCPADVSITIPNGSSEGFVNMEPSTAEDNCPGVDISNDYNAGGAEASDNYPLGTTVVIYTAGDDSGNSSTCSTSVTVTEDGGPALEYEISGNVQTTFGVNINNVELLMSGDEVQAEFTNPQGDYEFTVEGGHTVTITPEKDENWLDGVTTFDLILIQSHILSIIPLNDPYKMIAGDGNGNGQISTFDLVLLQSMIIGIIDEIPGNTSWRFIPAEYEFSDPDNPFADTWPESKTYPSLSGDEIEEDWVAMKTGDVTGEAGSSGIREIRGEYEFVSEQKEDGANGWKVSIKMGEREQLKGYQMEFGYDPERMRLERIDRSESQLKDLNEWHFKWDEEEGVIRANWWHSRGQEFEGAEELFSLHFTPLQEGVEPREELELRMRGSRWHSEAYNNESEIYNVSLKWLERLERSIYTLHQNEPNPFTGETIIPFELPQAMEVKLEIMDATGKLLQVYEVNGRKGMNRYRINLDGDQSGLLYYHLKAEDWSGVKKMISVE